MWAGDHLNLTVPRDQKDTPKAKHNLSALKTGTFAMGMKNTIGSVSLKLNN